MLNSRPARFIPPPHKARAPVRRLTTAISVGGVRLGGSSGGYSASATFDPSGETDIALAASKPVNTPPRTGANPATRPVPVRWNEYSQVLSAPPATVPEYAATNSPPPL